DNSAIIHLPNGQTIAAEPEETSSHYIWKLENLPAPLLEVIMGDIVRIKANYTLTGSAMDSDFKLLSDMVAKTPCGDTKTNQLVNNMSFGMGCNVLSVSKKKHISNTNSTEAGDFLIVLPNPAKGVFQIHYARTSDEDIENRLLITNAVGNLITYKSLIKDSGTISIDAHSFPQGLYIATLIGSDGLLISRKFVVE
ncbi:MAG: T9SS type A sorting domain-containing protein, partial [Cytophagales bacterium]